MTTPRARKQRPRLLKPRTVYQGPFFTVKRRKVIYPSGMIQTWERIHRLPAVAIFALDRRGRLLLIREYRHVLRKWRWGVPAGRVDKEVSPRAAAQRELQEETGYRARRLALFQKGPHYCTFHWPRSIYIAQDLVRDPLPQDESEEIRMRWTPLRTAYQMVLRGDIEVEFIALGIVHLYHRRKQWLAK